MGFSTAQDVLGWLLSNGNFSKGSGNLHSIFILVYCMILYFLHHIVWPYIDLERTSEGQPSVPETPYTVCMRKGEPSDSDRTKPAGARERPRTDRTKHSTIEPKILLTAEWPCYTEKTAKMFHDTKPFSHDTKPVYDMLVQTNTLIAMTNTTMMGSIFLWSHGTDSWKTAEGSDPETSHFSLIDHENVIV